MLRTGRCSNNQAKINQVKTIKEENRANETIKPRVTIQRSTGTEHPNINKMIIL